MPTGSSGDVISGMAVDWIGMDVHVKLGDARSNPSRDIPAAHLVMDDERCRLCNTLIRLGKEISVYVLIIRGSHC